MTHTFTATVETFWIARDEEQVHANGILEPGQSVSTGQPFLETFTDPRAYNIRLVKLTEGGR